MRYLHLFVFCFSISGVKHSLPDPEKFIIDAEAHLKKVLRRYRTNFLLQQNVVPIFSAVLPKLDFIARMVFSNVRFKYPNQLKVQQEIKNKKIDQKNKKTLNFVSANILQGVQGVGKELLFSRFWNSIFFEKFPSPWLEKIFHKDVSQSLKKIFATGNIDVLGLQEVFSADAKDVAAFVSEKNQILCHTSSPTHVFLKKYNVATLLATQKKIKTQSVRLTDSLQDLFAQAEKLSWGINLVFMPEFGIYVINIHAPLVAVRRQFFWKKFMIFLVQFWDPTKKIILMGDFNRSPTEIKKIMTKFCDDFFLFDLPTFHMEKPPVSMKLDNCVILGFGTTPFVAKATTHDIGSDHRALRVELSF